MGRDLSVDGDMGGFAVVWWWGVRGREWENCEPIYYAFADLDTNALLRNDPESSDMNALQAAPLTGGREYNSSQVSVSVTAGRKHGVDVRLDQNDLLWFDASFGKSTGRLCARSSSSFFF